MMSERNPVLWDKAKSLASRGYTTIISEDVLSDGTRVYLAEHPELEGCMTQGETPEQAQNDLKEVTVDFIYYLLEDGLNVPSPKVSLTITSGAGSEFKLVGFEPYKTFTARESELTIAETEENLEEGIQPEDRKTIVEFSVVERNRP